MEEISMPHRIIVPGPAAIEESRQLAEAVSDVHYVMGTIVEGAKELIPGESVEELTTAWQASEESFQTLVTDLTLPAAQPKIQHQTLVNSQLAGDVGKVKLSTLRRLKDRFFMFWHSEPRTDEKRGQAADAASNYLELSSTVVSSIPGYEKIVELLSLVKQLIDVRMKRGT
jgi:hypothetical protein